LVKEHNPAEVEKDWYAWWESKEFFTPVGDGTKPPFVIATPPPNVTGSLHIGHALGVTI
jgi:valyl-tRNA synthetase